MLDIPDNLDEESKRLLQTYPIRNPGVRWRYRDGLAVLEYKKEFTRFEKRLHKLLGGPENIKRPLDRIGTQIWEMCDGRSRAMEICEVMDERHHEEIEPALYRVWGFIQVLMERNLVYLEKEPLEGEASRPEESDEDEEAA